MTNQTIKPIHWIILFTIGAIWGSSFILMKIGLKAMTPLEIAAGRNAAAFLTSFPFLFAGLKNIPIKDWKFVIIAAYFGSGFPAILYGISSLHLDSSINGVLNGLTPLFTLVFGVFIFKNNSLKNKYIGVLMGFLGATLLVFSKSHYEIKGISLYVLLPILAASFYGISGNTVKTYLSQYNSFQVTSMLYLFLGIPALTYLFYAHSFDAIDMHAFDWTFWETKSNVASQEAASFTAIFILGAFGTAIANFGFYYLIKKTTVLFGAMTTYIIPIIALFWGYVAGEELGASHLFAMLFILVGVWMVSRK